MAKIALIGLGPHSKRIYLNYFKKYNSQFLLLVELESNKVFAREYLDKNGFTKTCVVTIPDQYKDNMAMPKQYENALLRICQSLKISHIIISTEPKAHNMYLSFALRNNIHVLSDKPIVVTKHMTSLTSINKIREQYYSLLKLSEKSSANCTIMCQRKFHKGYEYILDLLEKTVKKYQIPITYIQIDHCDGNWEMPHDLLKENHPYKFGYGKLYHSGYHFIDLLSDILKINLQLSKSKRIYKGEVVADCFTPHDEIAVCNIDDYKRIFCNQNIPEYYYHTQDIKFKKFGEKNFYGLFRFRNRYNQTITTANLNLLHYGFSRRAWIETRDFYKFNGRIRHEHIDIQVGPLMNIKVHSYQSKEIKDRLNNIHDEEKSGGLEHFDIEIFRNSDLIGGKPYEKITLGDLYMAKEKENILGFNELAREKLLTSFLNNKVDKSNLKTHILGIEMLYSCTRQVRNYYKKIIKPEKINFLHLYNYIDISVLKKFKQANISLEDKKTIRSYTIDRENYEFGARINYMTVKKSYEVYVYIAQENNIASGLLYKEVHNKATAFLYYFYFVFVLNYRSFTGIVRLIERKS